MAKKPQPGTVEWLRSFPSFKDCSDEEAMVILKSLNNLSEDLLPIIAKRVEHEKKKKKRRKK